MLPQLLTVRAACAALIALPVAALGQIPDAERLQQLVDSVQERIDRYETRLTGEMLRPEARLFGTDERAATMRQGVLDYLGIRPELGTLYVFVSQSMPAPMIEAYLAEAVWSGAILVVRGLAEHQTLDDWARTVVAPLVRDKGATATLTIDPVLFDQYAVTAVPTIVWDETADRVMGGDCDTVEVERVDDTGRVQRITTCRPFAEGAIYRLAGAVTLDYALESFAAQGAVGAGERLEQLRRYYDRGGRKDQPAEAEAWDAFLSDEARARLQTIRDRLDTFESAQTERFGPLFERDHDAWGDVRGVDDYRPPRLVPDGF